MPVQDLLPDIITWQAQLNDRSIDTTTIPGRTLLRLSNGTPNLGPGRLELRGSTVISGNQQIVNQRVYRDNNTTWDRQAGTFTYHPSHGHIHFDRWCVYRLREITAGNGVGPVIAQGQKTSFCILDLTVYDSSLPGYIPGGYYNGCGATVQGLTPGWADIYSRNLTDQWIDITGVPNGTYWLESEVDPDNLVLEANETNNASRVQVTIGTVPPPQRDAYEENDTFAQVITAPERVANSPNLGIVNGLKVIDYLSMEDNADYFRFRLNNRADLGDYVKIESTHPTGDLDLKLYNAYYQLIGSSTGNTHNEQISLAGLNAGVYYILVYPDSGTNPRYKLTIDPAANALPSISLTQPDGLGIWVERSAETFPVRWTASDPEGDPLTVSLYMDRDRVFDKNSLPIGGYQSLNGYDFNANVNTAEMGLGIWNVYAKITDGGGATGAWAPGIVGIYIKGDVNFDGELTLNDWAMMLLLWLQAAYDDGTMPNGWYKILDMNRDNLVDDVDINIIKNFLGL